ncbi:MAG: FtsX-like permease family protein [Bacillota bacterium]|jgi:hypothetical protein|nr:ABC transporter permease [Candidatus Fermentithermobacillaceae bacterium]
MAPSSSGAHIPSSRAYTPGQGQAIEIPRPKPNYPVYNLIALGRIRFTKAFAALVALSVFLSVAVSFLITTIIAKNVEVLAARVQMSKLPFHGLITFDRDMGDLTGFQRSLKWSGSTYRVKWAEVESNIGRLWLLGTGYDLPEDAIQLLFYAETGDAEPSISAWLPGNPSQQLRWQNVILPCAEESFPALHGWALVHPDFISKLGNERQGILLELPDRLGFNPRNPVGTSTINRYFAQVERNVPEEATVITPYSGTMSLRRATRGAFASWQVISLLVLLSAAAAITCVLTVSFLGRKRSLGIFRVLGGTVADLRRSMALEAAYISLPGIVLGVIAGRRFAGLLETGDLMPPSAYVIAVITGILTMAAGVWMPLQLIKNANCDQLLNNRPVYVISNPSCANCGLCGGI